MPRSFVLGLILAALGLTVQFAFLTWGYLDPAHGPGRSIWLHPGLACAAGFTLASLTVGLNRMRRRRTRQERP